jgi:O-antigen polymerase
MHSPLIYKKATLFLLLILFTVGMNFHIPNYGGSGFDLPHNGMVSMIAVILISIASVKVLYRQTIQYSPLLPALFLLLLCLIIPGLFNYHAETEPLRLIVFPLLGILFLYFAIEQLTDAKDTYITLLYLICLATLIQVIYALLQKYVDLSSLAVYIFSGGGKMTQPTGIFQQQNILSSFLATGLLIASYLISRPQLYQQEKKSKFLLITLLLGTIMGALFILIVVGSRAAILGLLIGIILLAISRWKLLLSINRKIVLLFLISIVIISTYNYEHLAKFSDRTSHAIEALSTKNADTELQNRRRLVIWEIATDTYLKAPLMGHGLGNFEKEFQDQARTYNQSVDIKLDQFISHPHNEIIFWGIESGLLAITALLVFMGYYLYLLFSQGFRHGLQWLAILTPIGLQTQVSLPFYLSTVHLVVFLLLMAMSVQHRVVTYSITIPALLQKGIVAGVLGILIFQALFAWTLFNGILNMGAFKYTGNKVEGLLDTPLSNIALRKDAQVYKKQFQFIRHYKQGKTAEIALYIEWLNQQIKYNDNATLYHYLFKAHLSLGNVKEASNTISAAKTRYPYLDAQFENLKQKTLARYQKFQQQRRQNAR